MPHDAPDLCAIHIRKFPRDLKDQARARAAIERRTLIEWLIKAARAELARKPS
jgi:hypothetical protein